MLSEHSEHNCQIKLIGMCICAQVQHTLRAVSHELSLFAPSYFAPNAARFVACNLHRSLR